jgi:hydroxyacylglutathione hydrolase
MKFIGTFIILIVSALGYGRHRKQVPTISLETMQQQIELSPDIQLVDVRTSKEYRLGAIAHAVNIPIAKRRAFKTLCLKTLHKDKPVFLYCYSGVRSHRAGKILIHLGFSKVYDFSGGWKVWQEHRNLKP